MRHSSTQVAVNTVSVAEMEKQGLESMLGRVIAVHRNAMHAFSKSLAPFIEIVEGHGVLGDAHFGVTVKHRSRVARDPTQPNLRQVHLLQQELLQAVGRVGIDVNPGDMGENVTTCGIDLLALSTGTRLRLGAAVVLEVTGLRNPCSQIEAFRAGLLQTVLEKTEDGVLVRKAGVMSVVVNGGAVQAGDEIEVIHVPALFRPLVPV
ncbi:MAG TPA: MOSC domain-containing protein [Hydrogenophaga sp.]|nr:MOSC domain-containing protein [Hydrogenophaga sp.]